VIEDATVREHAETYLKSLIAQAADGLADDFDSTAPFGDLGISSFYVLKILSRLEADFGRLPKSLLFEHFNAADLAAYFCRQHEVTLRRILEARAPNQGVHSGKGMAQIEVSAPAASGAEGPPQARSAMWLTQVQALATPEVRDIVLPLHAAHGAEGAVSRGTQKIAPNLFIGASRRGYFHFGISRGIALVYGFAGPRDCLQDLAAEMLGFCVERGLQLHLLADEPLDVVGQVPFTATPFGVLQRLTKLNEFALGGSAMRRLRYLVTKFEKSGVCRTQEYRCGSDKQTDLAIVSVMDRWCASRAVVNPMILDVRAEVLAGTIAADHRLFLTYLDDTLQNVVLITRMSGREPRYLMDLEFYPPEMPLGGLEFAIVEIVRKLVAEGCDLLSLGGTYGCKFESSAAADPEVDRILDELRAQHIFNDEGNLQFKNKFRPDNRTIYLCRPREAGRPESVLDIIMMIADPVKTQTPLSSLPPATAAPTPRPSPEPAPQAPARAQESVAAPAQQVTDAGRLSTLLEFGFNTFEIPASRVGVDLKTDSWAQLDAPMIAARMRHLQARLQQPLNVEAEIAEIFPFPHAVLTASGQEAERIFFASWPTRGVVLQNLLFPSTIFHQVDQAYTPVELPGPGGLWPLGADRQRAELDLAAVEERLREARGSIALVCVELSNNATGGCPISLAHLRALKSLLSGHAVPLVLDITRVVDNAQALLDTDPELAGLSVWSVVQRLLSLADVAIGSLTKNFCVAKGGIVATRDPALAERMRQLLEQGGRGLDLVERKLIALALQDRALIESRVLRRMAQVQQLGHALQQLGLPVLLPIGGHCVLIDTKQLPAFGAHEHPAACFLAWLYLHADVRAAAHSLGMHRQAGAEGVVRLALPVGMGQQQVDELVRRLQALFQSGGWLPRLVQETGAGQPMGAMFARYRALELPPVAAQTAAGLASNLNPAAAVQAPAAAVEAPARTVLSGTTPDATSGATPGAQAMAPVAKAVTATGPAAAAESRWRDVAVVGMAGRYPGAADNAQLWDLLVNGRDCIRELPPERHALRPRAGAAAAYRGGFIEDVDRFDSLFFNISPREAEMLDPQERLFLEVAWEAIEDGGYYPETLTPEGAPRDVGVFVGAVWTMYQMLGEDRQDPASPARPNSFLWSIANRVSYWMNLTGPSITLDTACSSSLTALYLACEAIGSGACSSAIVGGVNLDLHQAKFDINKAGGALSEDGLCRSFGKGANGYVAGEGVGALLLKPLDLAERDGDHIYGVIKGAVVNHGGRTSGYTVPNPKAQAGLIRATLQRARVDARDISYVEAHGTGTELGDPIEVSALTDAFGLQAGAPARCALGSIKSNIGHLEAAAGVAGVAKVLLQMRHRRLVPSLHSAELNGFIDFANSPFQVQQAVQDWVPASAGDNKLPLRAGVSSFGAGGANAHVVLESHARARPDGAYAAHGLLLFPVSARTDDALKRAAGRLAVFVAQGAESLADMAHTLQVGRRPFDHRLVVVAATREHLLAGLAAFAEGRASDDVHTGHARDSEGVTRLLNRREREEFVRLVSQSRDPRRLAALWAEGLLSEWHGHRPVAGARRVSMPTYPFADRRHWVALAAPASGAATSAGASLHALLDANESTFERQVFRKTFHEGDFFIYDHHVSGIATLPGTAYLELARKAGELSTGRPVRRIRNVLWVSPIAVRAGESKDAWIELRPAGDTVKFEVFSRDAEGAKLLHSQGSLHFAGPQDGGEVQPATDPGALRSGAEKVMDGHEAVTCNWLRRCSSGAEKVMDGHEAYRLFEQRGLQLGPSFQVLREVHKGEAGTLGQLALPASRLGDLDGMVLHPALVDGALQAGVAGSLGQPGGEMYVPYSIGEVEILHPLPAQCWSWVTRAQDGRPDSQVLRTHVDIMDASGRVLVRIRESTGVPLRNVHRQAEPGGAAQDFGMRWYAYHWEPAPALAVDERRAASGTVVLFAGDARLRESLARYRVSFEGVTGDLVLVLPGERFERLDANTFRVNPRKADDAVHLFETLAAAAGNEPQKVCFAWPLQFDPAGAPSTLDADLEAGVHPLLHVCQAIVRLRREAVTPLLYVYDGAQATSRLHHEPVAAFLKALRLEHPRATPRAIELALPATPVDLPWAAVLAEAETPLPDATAVRHLQGQRWVRRLKLVDAPAPAQDAQAHFRPNGVYLITGGAGGLGRLFAGHLAQTCQARMVLVGRSPSPQGLSQELDRLRALGGEAVYLCADIAEPAEAARVVAATRERFGALHGVLHAAGVIRDALVRNKTRAEMELVFASKLRGTLALDEATRDAPLDLFVLFSSLAGVAGNAGQSDYSYANHFMDSFAAERELLRLRGERSGRTLSVNWAPWAEGGMALDVQTAQYFEKTLGIRPLATEAGLAAFHALLASDHTSMAVLDGVPEKIETAWGMRERRPVQAPAAPAEPTAAARPAAHSGAVGQGGDGDLLAWFEACLSSIASGFLKLDEADLAKDAVLLDLGFDSLGLTTFANAINDRFQLDITPVLFFDFPSLQEIARHLVSERSAELQQLRGTETPAPASGAVAVAVPAATQVPSAPLAALDFSAQLAGKSWNAAPAAPVGAEPAGAGSASARPGFDHEPIAIVGISGVMPESEDLEAFWRNLRDTKDLISVIPESRWRWQDYDGNPLKEANKTNSRWGGFMKEVDKFDPLFFGISPREAEAMDPQQRIFLEMVWSAIEDAGQKVSSLSGTRTGVFVGSASNDYLNLLNSQQLPLDGYTVAGNSHCILANRVSFLLNLRGPSAPIDTACASSLIAVHRAVESIHAGSSDMAIAGGVQVILSPAASISFSMAGMLSGDGRCKTFDKRANGYVRGEGAGAVFLKRLSQALADGNHIYGIIRSSAENHGGKVTTLTAPNSAAQAELLVEAYQKAGIEPETVGYIECHGTGTSIGDPIEVQALSKAFAELYKRQGRAVQGPAHCGLSSVKTNIGHLETAAGVAGVLKVLLALKHQQIPANLHFEELNPFINLAGTPFYIADRLTEWKAPLDREGRVLPRRAGVSSFGFGGANAHVVIEEYVAPPRAPRPLAGEPRLFVLSARNEDRLNAYARALLRRLESEAPVLDDLVYTLQVGRDELQERLAWVSHDVDELAGQLRAYLADATLPAQGFRGSPKSEAAKAGLAARPQLDAMLQSRALPELARQWVLGAGLDWVRLYDAALPRRISLPTYPFARQRCWLLGDTARRPVASAAAAVPALEMSQRLHPLVHRNVSTLRMQAFASAFSGQEMFFADHMVETQKILPGVAYMEMARIAGEIAGDAKVASLHGITWERPIVIDANASTNAVAIELEPEGREVRFKVTSTRGRARVLHCSGRVSFDAGRLVPQVHDLQGIRSRCPELVISGTDLYAVLRASGLKLGPSFQIVQTIHASTTESIAAVRLPAHLECDAGDYLLHPALMDGCLHTAIGLLLHNGMDMPLSVPYSVEEVRIFGPLQDLRFGYATWASDEPEPDLVSRKVNFDLLDAHGRVLVQMRNFLFKPYQVAVVRAVPAMTAPAPVSSAAHVSAPTAQVETLHTLLPLWSPVPAAERQIDLPQPDHRLLLIGGGPQTLAWLRQAFVHTQSLPVTPDAGVDALAAMLAGREFDELVWVAPDLEPGADGAGGWAQAQKQGVMAVFRLVKALLQSGFANRSLRWTFVTARTQAVAPGQPVQPAHAGVVGLVGSLAKEQGLWNLRLLDVEDLASVPARECLAQPWARQGDPRACRQGQWFHQQLAAVTADRLPIPTYRHHGVYVVIGGAGGVGEVWSRCMIETYHARIVWIGRRAPDAALSARLEELGKIATAPLYIAADARDPAALARARTQILEHYPRIHGVVHSAIVLQDQTLARMEEAAMEAALTAKTDICVAIDDVFGAEELDFVLFFSSIISHFKTPGQANYAAGCTFKDSFAHHLGQHRPYPVKTMNWGYWGSVGVVADPSYRKQMTRLGIGSIEPAEGIASLAALMDSSLGQLFLIKTLNAQAADSLQVAQTLEQQPGEPATAWPLKHTERLDRLAARPLAPLEAGLPSASTTSLVSDILAATLQSIGLLGGGPAPAAATDGRRAAAYFDRWLARTFEHLADCGILHPDRTPAGPLRELDALWSAWEAEKTAWADNHNLPALLLVEVCLKALPDILLGRRAATSVLFPNSSMALVEGIYRANAVADYFNEALGQTLVAGIEQAVTQGGATAIRILEIGAGTGGTTAKLMPMLAELPIAEYCYTDISKAFLLHAEKNFRPQAPFLKTALFDVTRPLAAQDIAPGSYDFVIAANALHATADINVALRNAKAALKRGGVLLLNEISVWSLTNHLTFGLLEGWWLHQDSVLRLAGSPGLAPATWAQLLADEGFMQASFPVEAAHHLGYQIVAAASDGWVRQQRAVLAPRAAAKEAPPAAARVPEPLPSTRKDSTMQLPPAPAASANRPDIDQVRRVITSSLAAALMLDASAISPAAPFADYGVDSIIGVDMVRAVGEALGLELEATLLFEHSTVDQLARYLVGVLPASAAVMQRAPAASASAPASAPAYAPAPAPAPAQARAPARATRSVDAVKAIIVAKLAAALMMDASGIDPDSPFSDFGVDSIIGVDLVRSLGEALGIELDATVLFDHSTVAQLAQHVATNWPVATGGGDAVAARDDLVEMRAVQQEPAAPETFPSRRFASATVDAPPTAAEPAAAVFDAGEPIAIVGMSGRFAESDTLDEFWRNLRSRRELIGPATRWAASECTVGDPGRPHCTQGSFIDSIDRFDPGFFGISREEALYMDPQQRLFLEESWKALEDAGYAGRSEQRERCGVYAGCGNSSYGSLLDGSAPPLAFWGNLEALVPARIAYFLDLHGPAIAINTACSSSLVAMHTACQALRSGEIGMALAGGVFLQPTPAFLQFGNRAGMLSPDGECRSFDASANGFVPGEGVGVLVLKRVRDALRDGDHIHGIIRGSGVNQDGSSNGIIAPSARAQEALERAVYQRFGIEPASLQLVEAHGTGTLLGDSMEVLALSRVFANAAGRRNFCALGSVKSNIGHASTAAGVAGALKVLLAMKHRQIPPTLHFRQGSPELGMESGPFYVNTELVDWQVDAGVPRRAAVSAFGFGGTNAHIVLEEAPHPRPQQIHRPGCIAVLSAASRQQLRQRVQDLVARLVEEPGFSLNDICHSLLVGRRQMAWRLACVATDVSDLVGRLRQWIETGKADEVHAFDTGEGLINEKASLRRFGNHCIAQCTRPGGPGDPGEYLDNLSTIADLHVQGYALDLAALFPQGSRRVPLPTYPFADERYWVRAAVPAPQSSRVAAATPLGPWSMSNESILGEQRFVTTFEASTAGLLAGAAVGKGHAPAAVLPSMSLLAWTARAYTRAHGDAVSAAPVELRDVTWSGAVALQASRSLMVTLLADEDGAARFEIADADAPSQTVCCRGVVGLLDAPSWPPLDIAGLRARLARVDAAGVGADLCWPEAQGQLAELQVGDAQFLARLAPPAAGNGGGARGQEPSPGQAALDGLLQVCRGLLEAAPPRLVPAAWAAAAEAVCVLPASVRPVYAWGRRAVGTAPADGTLVLDIDLADEDGVVVMKVRGLVFGTGDAASDAAPHGWHFAGASAPPPAGLVQEPGLAGPQKLECFMRQEVSLLLRRPWQEVPLTASYFDLGLSSLATVELLRKTNQLLGIELSPSTLFEYRDIRTLAAHLAQAHAEAVEGLNVFRTAVDGGDSGPARPALDPWPRRPRRATAVQPVAEARVSAPSVDDILARIQLHEPAEVDGYEQTSF
jgi:polyketide synthase PksN